MFSTILAYIIELQAQVAKLQESKGNINIIEVDNSIKEKDLYYENKEEPHMVIVEEKPELTWWEERNCESETQCMNREVEEMTQEEQKYIEESNNRTFGDFTVEELREWEAMNDIQFTMAYLEEQQEYFGMTDDDIDRIVKKLGYE